MKLTKTSPPQPTKSVPGTLVITDLHAGTPDAKDILRGVSLTIRRGEIHAVMGPNGGGKSTLAQVLMGHPGYQVSKGKVTLDGADITGMPVDERAKLGLFLGFQYPVEVAGVNFAQFLRLAVNTQTGKSVSPIAFRTQLTAQATDLAFTDGFAGRSLNEGFSGGEKKKSEILQMIMLRPKFAILDEPDSGLDVDALKYISTAVTALNPRPGLLLITHYQRILHYIKPDHVHILIAGKIVKSGSADLAASVESTGYAPYQT